MTRAQWVENGEKPSKFFLQLEKSNYINKSIKELAVDENTTITDQTLIIDELRNFFKDLYSNKLSTRDLKESLKKLDTSGLKKIPDEMSEALNEQISFKELSDAVFSSKNHTSPGPDAFSVEFYKVFWDQIGHLFHRAIISSYSKGRISLYQKQGIISCIPKGNKPRKYLKNWHPISLLNSSY